MTYTSLRYMASEPTWEVVKFFGCPDPPISFCTSLRSSYKRSVPVLCPSNGDVLATPLTQSVACWLNKVCGTSNIGLVYHCTIKYRTGVPLYYQISDWCTIVLSNIGLVYHCTIKYRTGVPLYYQISDWCTIVLLKYPLIATCKQKAPPNYGDIHTL